MGHRWFKRKDFGEWYKLETETSGRGFRFFTDAEQTRYEFFTFGERTANFIEVGLMYETLEECTEEEYLIALKDFLEWTQIALKQLDYRLAGLKAA
jgi:hypothetical protein